MAAVWHRSALTAYADIFPSDAPKPTVDDMARALTGNHGFVYEVDGAIVGLVQVIDGDWMARLYVDPPKWRRGIASELHDVAVASGARHLWVLRKNAVARAMYERRGWKLSEETQPVYEAAGIEDVRYDLT